MLLSGDRFPSLAEWTKEWQTSWRLSDGSEVSFHPDGYNRLAETLYVCPETCPKGLANGVAVVSPIGFVSEVLVALDA